MHVQIVKEKYNELSNDIVLQNRNLPKGVSAVFEVKCPGQESYTGKVPSIKIQ